MGMGTRSLLDVTGCRNLTRGRANCLTCAERIFLLLGKQTVI